MGQPCSPKRCASTPTCPGYLKTDHLPRKKVVVGCDLLLFPSGFASGKQEMEAAGMCSGCGLGQPQRGVQCVRGISGNVPRIYRGFNRITLQGTGGEGSDGLPIYPKNKHSNSVALLPAQLVYFSILEEGLGESRKGNMCMEAEKGVGCNGAWSPAAQRPPEKGSPHVQKARDESKYLVQKTRCRTKARHDIYLLYCLWVHFQTIIHNAWCSRPLLGRNGNISYLLVRLIPPIEPSFCNITIHSTAFIPLSSPLH